MRNPTHYQDVELGTARGATPAHPGLIPIRLPRITAFNSRVVSTLSNRTHYRTAPALLAVVALLVGTPVSGADQCGSCAFFECLSNVIKQKEAIRIGYADLAKKWDEWAKQRGEYWVSAGLVPRDVIDLETLPQNNRAAAMAAIREQQAQFGRDEEEMTAKIGTPTGCGFARDQNLELSTETVLTCAIDMQKAKVVELAVPCRSEE